MVFFITLKFDCLFAVYFYIFVPTFDTNNDLSTQVNDLSTQVKAVCSAEAKSESKGVKESLMEITTKVNGLTSTTKPADVPQPDNDEHRKESVVILNVPEVTDFKSPSDRLLKENSNVEKVLKIVKCADAVITDVYRRGSFIKNARKPRPLIVQFHNAITAKRVKASSGLLKDSSFFLRGDCTREERKKEEALLKTRYLFSQKGIRKEDMKIKNLTLYYKDKQLDTLADDDTLHSTISQL